MLALAERFVARGLNCDLVIAITEGQLLESVPPGVRLIKFGKRKPLHATFALAKYLRRNRPDVMLTTVFAATIAGLLGSALSFTGTRTVICSASVVDMEMRTRKWWKTLSNKIVARLLYRRAAAAIAVSQGVRTSLLQHKLVSPEQIHVVPNPLPPIATSMKDTLELADKPTLLACGRLEHVKDHATLLRAFARLRKRMDVRLVILGEGSLRGKLEDQASALGIGSEVAFPGFDPDPYRYMRAASVFVHTARYEGFGVVLIEALACGCPVIATDGPGGVRDVLEDGKYGALVPVGDDVMLADTIEAVLTRKLTFPDAEHHLRKFDIETVTDAYVSILLDADCMKQT